MGGIGLQGNDPRSRGKPTRDRDGSFRNLCEKVELTGRTRGIGYNDLTSIHRSFDKLTSDKLVNLLPIHHPIAIIELEVTLADQERRTLGSKSRLLHFAMEEENISLGGKVQCSLVDVVLVLFGLKREI